MNTPWAYSFGPRDAGPLPHGWLTRFQLLRALVFALARPKGVHRFLALYQAGSALARALPSRASSTAIADAPSPVGDLGKVYGAPAITTIPVPRIHYLARRIHLVGERPLAELFIQLETGGDLHGMLEEYASFARLVDFIRALRCNRLTMPRPINGGRR